MRSRLGDFERTGDLKWVSAPIHHVRRIVEFQAIKGAEYSGRWGYSIDFVPVLTGSRVAWKRAPSKAQFDLCIDPIDDLGRVPDWCSFGLTSSDQHRSKIGNAVANAAVMDFESVASLNDLCTVFQTRSDKTFSRFSLANYTQTDLAWGLALLACGHEAQGRQHIDKFCNDFSIDPEIGIIQKSSAEARSVALGAMG
jgi:hypothetical protein